MGKLKVDEKEIKSFGGKHKAFEIEIKEMTFQDRSEINDLIFDDKVIKNFTFWVQIIRRGTNLSDDDINKYSNSEIFAIGSKIISEMNKKK